MYNINKITTKTVNKLCIFNYSFNITRLLIKCKRFNDLFCKYKQHPLPKHFAIRHVESVRKKCIGVYLSKLQSAAKFLTRCSFYAEKYRTYIESVKNMLYDKFKYNL